jgi:tetratricopeptide (TPR) repeat protein
VFECRICGLLSLGGAACPACGSQLRTDLSESMEGDETLPTDVPGLDDAAEAWYDLEGIEPPVEDGDDGSVASEGGAETSGLPFGFQGESKVFAPSLPFGIGSFADGIPFDAAGQSASQSAAIPSVETEQPLPSTPPSTSSTSTPSPSPQEALTPGGGLHDSIEEWPPVAPLPEPAAPAPTYATELASLDEKEAPPTTPAPAAPIQQSAPNLPSAASLNQNEQAGVPEAVPEPMAEPTPFVPEPASQPAPPTPANAVSHEPVRLQSARLVQASPTFAQTEAVTEVVSETGIESISEAAVFNEQDSHDVPDYWKIDASIPNYEEIYDQDDDVVEVEHGSFNEDVVVYDHTTDSPAAVFHTPLEASPVATAAPLVSLSLHPVQALQVDVGGSPELSAALSEGFTMMQQGSWSQAARVFQRMAARLPNNPEVFNNYGISLLQRAKAMRDGADSQQHGLANAQFESAILALREAAKGAPSNSDVLVNLACALIESGRSEKALGIMNVHNARTPGSAKGMNTAAVAMFNLGQLSQASETLQKATNDAIAQANLRKLAPAQGA